MEPWVELLMNAGINLVLLLLATEIPFRERFVSFFAFSVVPVIYYSLGLKDVLFMSKTGIFSLLTIGTFFDREPVPPVHPIGTRTFVIPDPVVECKQD